MTRKRSPGTILAGLWGGLRSAVAQPKPPTPAPAPGIAPSRAPSWTEEAVAGGTDGAVVALGSLARVLDSILDAFGVPFDDKTINDMLRDPAVSAGTSVLALGLAEHSAHLRPTIALSPAERPGEDPEKDRLAEQAQAVLEFDRRALEKMETPLEDVLLAMGVYPARQTELAETTYRLAPDVPLGVGLGYTIARIRHLPREAWRFVADPHGNVVGVYARTGDSNGDWEVLPPEKFCWLSWRPPAGDPRGSSILRPARGAWAIKAGHAPDLSAYLRRFGQPVVMAKTGKSSLGGDEPASSRSDLARLGVPDATSRARLTPQQRLFAQVVKWLAGGVLVLKEDEEAELIEPRGQATALLNSFDWLDRQILLTILLNPRGLLESQYNSRADSQTAQQMIDRIVRVMRRQAERMVAWQILWRLNAINFGAEAADLYTPDVSLGGADQPDRAAMGGMWTRAGWKAAPEHLPIIDAEMGLPPRNPARDSARAG
jgi:hypothetical protein